MKLKKVNTLDYVVFNKNDAACLLENEFGWKRYALKHSESIFTRFYQNYFLPTKFGIDKRKAHLSSLIRSNQILKKEALDTLSQLISSDHEQNMDLVYVLKKLDISQNDFNRILKYPILSHDFYDSYIKKHYHYHFLLFQFLHKFLGKRT